MKKVAVILNTNQLGGAERSLIEQLSICGNESDFYFFIPSLKLSDVDLVAFIRSKGMVNIAYYPYPSALYKLSRKNLHKLPLLIFTSPVLLWFLGAWHRRFKDFSIFYVNGNKASFPILLWASLFRRKITMYWHFRDFPSPRAFRLIGRLVARVVKEESFINLKLIANSQAVETELRKYFLSNDIRCLYNLPGNLPTREAPNSISHIGVASMFAPWKGLHDVLLMAALYEKELRALGVKKISFFGDDIYQTAGEHQTYSSQLRELSKKFDIQLVQWAGKKSPEQIFSEIDVLIHPSLQPEPFGRVIIEAFKSRVPVISTGIGGARELLTSGETGLQFEPHDYDGLFKCLEALTQNPILIQKFTDSGFKKVQSIESNLRTQVSDLF